MIASITKDKKLHIIDPRKSGSALVADAHQGIKA
jgi:anaerobic selenocysteine-containing dehydrogenase